MSLSANLQQVNHNLFIKGDQQAAIVHLGRLALSSTSSADLISQAVVLVTQVLPVETCLVWDLLADRKDLLLVAEVGLDESAGRLQIPLDTGSLEAFTLTSHFPLVVGSTSQECRFTLPGCITRHEVKSGASVLIGTPERPYGILEVFSKQTQTFLENDLFFLQSVANTLGLVIRQDRSEEDLVVQNHDLMKELVRAQYMTPSGHFQWDRYEIRNRLIESRERERLRLAQDLHDGPIQDLYGLIYQLDDLRDLIRDPDGGKVVDEYGNTLHQVVNNLRTVCRELRPPSLSPFGLEVAIRDHVEKFCDQNPGIQVHLQLMPDKQALPDILRLSLFRIYQQAMHNVARHAQAQDVYVRFNWDDEMIILEVEDNGRGFDVPQNWVELVEDDHHGLLGIAERVESIRGKLEIVSAPGGGTLIRTLVPH